MEYRYLTKPFKLKNKILRNSMVMPPMEVRLSNPDGSATDKMCAYYAARARGGVGMIIVENTFVDTKASRSSLVSSGLYSDHMIASKYNLAEAIKENGAVAIIQLSHGGRQANPNATGIQCVGPSAIPSGAVGRMPHALTIEEIHDIEDSFAMAARRAKMAGFDGIELHCAHGYLLSSFISPASNKRDDMYGGTKENRWRFPKETLEKIRAMTGDDFIVGMRVNGDDYLPDGLKIDECCEYVKSVQHLIDYVNVSAAFYEAMEYQIAPLYMPQAPIAHLAERMKGAVDIPVIAVNALTPDLGEKILEEGKADLIAFGRSLIADPELPKKVIEGRDEDIRPCCRGNEGCISLFFDGCPLRCEVNGRAGRETEYPEGRSQVSKKVVIVGGGMAGMEAARLAAERGHSVTLFEKTDKLGGHYLEGTEPSFKHEGRNLIKYLIRQMEKLGVDVRLGEEADAGKVKALNPDAVITAVGSHYAAPPIPGIEKAMMPDTALMEPDKTGKNVIVIGGGLIGTETAFHLAEKGRDVTIVEMLSDIALSEEGISRAAVLTLADRLGIKKVVDTKVTCIGDGIIKAEGPDGETELKADTIICATGLIANDELRDSFMGLAEKTYNIGDCVRGRKIFECTAEAWHAVYDLEK